MRCVACNNVHDIHDIVASSAPKTMRRPAVSVGCDQLFDDGGDATILCEKAAVLCEKESTAFAAEEKELKKECHGCTQHCDVQC